MKTFIVFAVISIFLLAGCSQGEQQIVGGDRDEHGCIGSAGYQWCPSSGKCQRMWEEYCAEFSGQFKINNFNDCAAAGNPVMESYPRQCSANGQTYTEEVESPAEPVQEMLEGGAEPGLNECSPESKEAGYCMAVYEPVCGYNAEGEGTTYSNSCVACKKSAVQSWTEGECP